MVEYFLQWWESYNIGNERKRRQRILRSTRIFIFPSSRWSKPTRIRAQSRILVLELYRIVYIHGLSMPRRTFLVKKRGWSVASLWFHTLKPI
ncbi:hypothetical protein [Ranid herpesvirus 3]|uniref:Uncharacterized protein n=1 Tax=Ranid herpesvirus 3 TaxID=1987509 RepID=A0A1X9T5F9_9VIRU|nr:hypothetical protein [Ranid herpesvirus 3]ARR28936.1 hypothetical protein [Ranid herpesvirus 3]